MENRCNRIPCSTVDGYTVVKRVLGNNIKCAEQDYIGVFCDDVCIAMFWRCSENDYDGGCSDRKSMIDLSKIGSGVAYESEDLEYQTFDFDTMTCKGDDGAYYHTITDFTSSGIKSVSMSWSEETPILKVKFCGQGTSTTTHRHFKYVSVRVKEQSGHIHYRLELEPVVDTTSVNVYDYSFDFPVVIDIGEDGALNNGTVEDSSTHGEKVPRYYRGIECGFRMSNLQNNPFTVRNFTESEKRRRDILWQSK